MAVCRRSLRRSAASALLIWLAISSAAAADLVAEGGALLAFLRGLDRYPAQLLNWSNETSPCSWQGVGCSSTADSVVSLKLPSSGLYGSILGGTLANLSSLQILSLRSNHLSGSLPPDLLNSTRLRKLFLQNNLLSGALLPFDASLTPSLSTIDLSYNRFSHSIPPSFSSLDLRILLLHHNNLSGSIPVDLGGPSLKQLNLSDNLLSGEIPPLLRRFSASSFVDNAALCGLPTASICSSNGSAPASSPSPSLSPAPPIAATKSGGGGGPVLSALNIVLIAVADVAIVMLVAACCCLWRLRRKVKGSGEKGGAAAAAAEKKRAGGGEGSGRRRSRWEALTMLCGKGGGSGGGGEESGGGGGGRGEEEEEEEEEEAVRKKEQGSNVNKLVFFRSGGEAEAARESFDLEDLLRASAEVLGKGGFGTAYRAVLEGGQRLVVKRLKQVAVGRREFEQLLHSAARLRHANLLPLRAFYFSKEEKLLVYDYLPLGPLSASLYGPKKRELPWEERLAAAGGAARGLAAIHSAGPKMAHGAVKSSNVILDSKKGAVLTDYGLAGIFSAGTGPARMAGYRAPEVCIAAAPATTQKADVYAFGVVLLELLTARQAALMAEEEGMDLPRWVNAVVREEWTAEVFDKDLLRLPTTVEDELVQLLHLALACAATAAEKRPTMADVLEGLVRIRPNVVAEQTPVLTSSSASVSSVSPQRMLQPPAAAAAPSDE